VDSLVFIIFLFTLSSTLIGLAFLFLFKEKINNESMERQVFLAVKNVISDLNIRFDDTDQITAVNLKKILMDIEKGRAVDIKRSVNR
jgi:hypothetical protein